MNEQLIELTRQLSAEVDKLTFSRDEVTVYNPLDYAWEPHMRFLERFGNSKKRIIFLGMNPGPWGMAQTGVPFGEVNAVKDWLKIDEPVKKPEKEHPKRPILGFSTTRSEVSGRRLWGLMMERYPDPDDFFRDHFVLNYCPLVFMEPSGKNLTPDKLLKEDREKIEEICDTYIMKVLELFSPEILVGVGKYAQKKFDSLLKRMDLPEAVKPRVTWVLHPSPASPLANRGWAEAALKQMVEREVWVE